MPVSSASAHEIPTDVVIQTLLKPDDNKLEFLVRVPLEAMRDVNFPESGPGYLVISEADETLGMLLKSGSPRRLRCTKTTAALKNGQ